MLRLALTQPGGKVLHDTALSVELFPPPPVRLRKSQVTIIGARDGKAARLARELGLTPVFMLSRQPSVLLIDDAALLGKRRRYLEAAVAGGAVAVLLELPVNEYELAGSSITVTPCGMGARHFVSRATGHPLVDGFAPEDFRLWYDSAVDRISPLLETTFTAADWTPILTSGNGGWGGDWQPALAAAEKKDGKGIYRICQLSLAGRTAANPVAGIFARRLLTGV